MNYYMYIKNYSLLFFHDLLKEQLLFLTGPSFSDGDVRLVGSSFPAEGRVEIYHLGSWGTICDDHFGIEEANVICRQLKHSLGAQYWYHNAHFGMGNGPIWLDDVNCVGNETALINCKHIGWNNHNCHHYEDVGVVCLEGGRHSYLTYLEVFF